MSWDAYIRVSALMFLEFAIWGAWMPVLALRLLGPMKMTGKQTGWIYATLPLACIVAPVISGYLADRWFNAEWIMLVAHAAGAVLLFLAARQTKFWGMFWAMLIYCMFFTATLPLVNKVLFQHVAGQATWVFLWAPVAWALVGYFLTGMRQAMKLGGDGPDALYLAALLSVVMALVCLLQPATAPKAAAAGQAVAATNPMLAALAMLGNFQYLLFMLVQLVVSGMMQFYFLGTGQFMQQDRGISGKNVSAAMGIAQAVQAAATILLLDWMLGHAGYRGTFAVGALCWTIMYAVYVFSRRALWIVLIQAFHGLAYVLFMIGGQIFVGKMAPEAIGASAQSLVFIATTGVGIFLGTMLAGWVMDMYSSDGKFQWSRIWAVPLAVTLAGAVVFALVFRSPDPKEFLTEQPPAQVSSVAQPIAL